MIALQHDGSKLVRPTYRKYRPSRTAQLRDVQAVLFEVQKQLADAGDFSGYQIVKGMREKVERAHDRILRG